MPTPQLHCRLVGIRWPALDFCNQTKCWEQSIMLYLSLLLTSYIIQVVVDGLLPSYLLSSELCCWIKNLPTDRSIQVVMDGVSSLTQFFNSWVPYSCLLSPTTFLLHISELFGRPIIRFITSLTIVLCIQATPPISF